MLVSVLVMKKERTQISSAVPKTIRRLFEEIVEAEDCSQSQMLIMLVQERHTRMVERGEIQQTEPTTE